MKFSLSKALATVYFFFNSLGLPAGMLYTTLLSPIFALVLMAKGYAKHLLLFFVLLFPFFIVHLFLGVDLEVYLRSGTLIFTAYVFGLTVYHFAGNRNAIETIIRFLIRACFVATLIAIALYPTSFSDYVWRTESITLNIASIRRLILFTYEPSYLSTLIVPLWFYAFFTWLYAPATRNVLQLVMATLPLVFAFSFGVISTILITVVIVVIINLKQMLQLPHTKLMIFAGLALAVLILATPNPFMTRLESIVEGADHSGNSRTLWSFEMADEIASRKSFLWGIGLGQVKIEAESLLRSELKINLTETARLPNVMAEYLASLGYLGMVMRLMLLAAIFFSCKIYKNNFQLSLFIFFSIYQFTGSFMTNIAEAAIWALSARHIFSEMDRRATTSAKLPQYSTQSV
jgi:hypothetical protein